MKSTGLGAFVFILSAFAVVGHITARTEQRATAEVCELIRANYFRPEQSDVQQFLKQCETEPVPFTFSRAKTLKHINAKLSQIKSSHLTLYSPDENRWLWENEGSDTGIRARMIDGEVVIISTIDESPASRAKLQSGDVIVSINGEPISNALDAQSSPGFFKIMRGSTPFLTDLKLETVHEDLSPTLSSVTLASTADRKRQNQRQSQRQRQDRVAAILRIPSFLPTYFEKEAWSRLTKNLASVDDLVIDLRGNAGGSFPAMLRALSPFRCERTEVGSLFRSPRPNAKPAQDMADDLSADAQLAQMTASDEVKLKTFGHDYGCYNGHVTVLIDSATSSVSEIFAKAIEDLPPSRARVWGWTSAGQVVMARWFSIGSLGGGDYAMSIPIAGFKTTSGQEIERVGVTPQRELSYKLESALGGRDSWIDDALVSF